MFFIELARKRFSARKYKEEPVKEEKLMKVLEAGRIAPSAVNFQPWYFIVIRDEETRKQIASTYEKNWLNQAPVIIAVCGDHSRSWRRADGKDHCDIDIAIAVDHMTLAAAEMGLGTCWVCNFNSMECHKILGLPSHIEVTALLPLGYPAAEADVNRHTEKRKELKDIVYWDKFK